MVATKSNLQELVEKFNAIEGFEAKCAFFHEHPELATIFHSVHFPKPKITAKVSPPPTP